MQTFIDNPCVMKFNNIHVFITVCNYNQSYETLWVRIISGNWKGGIVLLTVLLHMENNLSVGYIGIMASSILVSKKLTPASLVDLKLRTRYRMISWR